MQKYFNYFLNERGEPIASASVTVKTSAGAVATIYSDNAGTVTANPLTTDSSGLFAFYAANGTYTLSLSKPGHVATVSLGGVLLHDPDDDPTIVSIADAVNSIADLRAAGVPAIDDIMMSVLGHTTPGDGGGGTFYWDSASTDADDGGVTILPTGYAGAGRWKRSYSGAVNLAWFGGSAETALPLALNVSKSIKITAGTFECASALTVNVDGADISGDGWSSHIKLGDTVVDGTRLFDVQANNVTIRNLRADGNYAARAATNGATIHFSSVKGFVVTGCYVESAGFDTIGASGASEGRIEGNIIYGGIDSGVDIVGGSNNIIVANNIVIATDDTLYPIALDTFDTVSYDLVNGITVADNVVVCGAANAQGVSVEGARQCSVTNNAIYVPTNGKGIKVFEQATGSIVSGNTIQLADSLNILYGIEINDQNTLNDKRDCKISGNSIYSASTARNYGVFAYQTGADIDDNSVVGCRYGILVNSNNTAKEFNIRNNTATGCSENYGARGNHATISTIYASNNSSISPVSLDWSIATGYEMEYVGARLDLMTTFGMNATRVVGDFRAGAVPASGTYRVGDTRISNAPTSGKNLGWVCVAAGTPGAWETFGTIDLQGSAIWDPGNLADGVGETSASIAVTGAELGDFAIASAPYDLQGITCNAYVDAANSVKIRLQNETGGAIDLASGTWRVKVIKQ